MKIRIFREKNRTMEQAFLFWTFKYNYLLYLAVLDNDTDPPTFLIYRSFLVATISINSSTWLHICSNGEMASLSLLQILAPKASIFVNTTNVPKDGCSKPDQPVYPV